MPPTTREERLAHIERLERLGCEAERQVVSAMPPEYYFEEARRTRKEMQPPTEP